MKFIKSIGIALLCGSAFAAMSHTAFADDTADFATKLAAAYGTVGYTMTFGPGTADGDTYTYDGVTVALASMPGTTYQVDGTLTFSGVSKRPDGGYLAKDLTVSDLDIKVDPIEVTVDNVSVKNVYVPGAATIGMKDLLQLLGSTSAGPIEVTTGGETMFSIASITADNTFQPEQGTADLKQISSVAAINGIEGDLSKVEDADAKELLAALGVTSFKSHGKEVMSWTMADGRMKLDELSVNLDGLGSIKFALDMSGYTPELMDTLAASGKQIAATPAGSAQDAASTALAMSVMQKVTVAGVSLRYDDASLAGKLLDYFAKKQNVTREQLVAGLKVLLPGMMAQAGNPELIAKVSAALNTFLDDPKSLEVRVAPKKPLGFADFAAASADPTVVPALLGLSITANDAPAPTASN